MGPPAQLYSINNFLGAGAHLPADPSFWLCEAGYPAALARNLHSTSLFGSSGWHGLQQTIRAHKSIAKAPSP